MNSNRTVHVVFKTHLDIGFTHLAAHVLKQYKEEYIPKAIALAEQLEAEGGAARFVWTTGSWLIRHYLDHASPDEKQAMEKAIRSGHIAWHGLPFTMHTELLDPQLLLYGLSISKELDQQFGKTTIAAKMTDVPGHTLSMVPYMSAAGIQYMHLGVNPASKRPDVPRLFRWQAEDGSEIIVNYAGSYGEAVEVEGMDDILLFAHTGDNCGPPSAEEIQEQFRDIQSKYPDANIVASTLDAFARRLTQVREKLPVLREEIGDTWIHGAGTDPYKVAGLRELLRLRKGWIESGRMTAESSEYKGMSDALLLVTEHTWGLDVKKWLPDFRNYAKADFNQARASDEIDLHDMPAKFGYIGAFAMNEFDLHSSGLFTAEQSRRTYSRIESSWAEQRAYLEQAVSCLKDNKQREAIQALAQLKPSPLPQAADEESISAGEIYQTCRGYQLAFSEQGAIVHLSDEQGKVWVDADHPFGEYSYETFGTEDYARYFRTYMQNLPVTHPWADADFSKPGFEFVRPLPSYQSVKPIVSSMHRTRGDMEDRYMIRMRMPAHAYESYGAPRELEIEYTFRHRSGIIDICLQWFDKDANRLPEASWFSCGLNVDNPNNWHMDKLGYGISPLHVAKGGNRNLHALGQGVFYEGTDGWAKLETLDAALAAPASRRLLQFDQSFASMEGGWHFNLHNNIWGTNFPMWYGEDAKFRFRLHLKSNTM
ncbi:DUF5054 domain-containing protein [Paenibacillus gorillae]|uniref:DUF5054 domain-containing protein n=1 Tax=Paenibacillus gorillae TaxID=1243662 RepID=UPI0004BB1D73|nr:DUF5054 domain-containing protein [Paenibacillus gorillae]